MNPKEAPNENPAAKGQTASRIPQQSPLPPQLQQHVALLNARITNSNLAQADLLKEVDNTFTAIATTIAALQKENAELKAKLAEPTKNQ